MNLLYVIKSNTMLILIIFLTFSLSALSQEKIALGGGLLFEVARPQKYLPGLSIAARNYLANERYFISGNLNYFSQIDDYENRIESSARLCIKIFTKGEVYFHLATGPILRSNFNNSFSSTTSLLASIMLFLDYNLSNSFILETSIENKFGFDRKPDTIFSFVVIKKL